MKTAPITLAATLVLMLGSQFALAANDDMKGPKGRRGPPPEAFTACEGKSAGDAAEFVSPRGDTIAGTCEERDGKLVLKPTNRPDRPERGERPARPDRSQ